MCVGNVIWILPCVYYVQHPVFQLTTYSNTYRLKLLCKTTRDNNSLNFSSPKIFLNGFLSTDSAAVPYNEFTNNDIYTWKGGADPFYQ